MAFPNPALLKDILWQMGYPEYVSCAQFKNEEDGEAYNVWRVELPECTCVLKKAKGNELDIYTSFLHDNASFAPKLYANTDNWLLMEYIPGNNLMRCDREALTKVLHSLITMQSQFWGREMSADALDSRLNRRQHLGNQRLERAYDAFLEDCKQIPSTLCHDDLLPFNVIVSDKRCVFIDWEVGGILPYPTSLARLIAHTEESEDAFFFMTESNRTFAIDYYFEKLVKGRGVTYDTYCRSLDLSLFYEYCEWVYVGNKYQQTNTQRYRKYLDLAIKQAEKLGY